SSLLVYQSAVQATVTTVARPVGIGNWDVVAFNTNTGTTRTVSLPGSDSELPSVSSNGLIVWQQGDPNATDIYGTIFLGFRDVFPTDYFYVPVRYLACLNIISGYSDGTFRPFNNTTRGQLTKLLVRGHEWPIVTPTTPTYADVDTGNVFYPYIETLVARGILG